MYKKKNKVHSVFHFGEFSRIYQSFNKFNECFEAWKKNKCRHYSISNKEYFSMLEVAKMFKSKIKMLPARRGERFASALTRMHLNNKVYKYYGKISLKNYVNGLISKQK